MAGKGAQVIAMPIMVLNFCMYMIVCGIAGWALNTAMERKVDADELEYQFPLPNPLYFPMGNAATDFFVIFSLIAGVVGASCCISGFHIFVNWTKDGLASAASTATTAWALTLLAMGLAWKEINLGGRNSRLQTLESFTIILSVTQFIYVALLHHSLTF